MKLLIVFIIACSVLYAGAKPTGETNQIGGAVIDIPDCHGVSCPSGTTSCQLTQVAPKTVHCLSGEGKILHSAPCPHEQGQEHGHGHGHGHAHDHGHAHGH